MKSSLATLLLAASLLGSVQVNAAAAAPAPTMMNIDELRTRLNLSAEQQAQIAPHAERRKAQLAELRAKVNDASSRRDKRAALQAARQAQEDFIKNVEPLLTPEQNTEWRKIRDEVRAEARERWLNRQ